MSNTTDHEMIALTSEPGELSNAEIKDKFRAIWDAIEVKEDTAYTFQSYCEGFEHLCAGVLKLKNYCGQSDERLIKGLSEIFEKIKGKLE